jgi:toxin ParE1/3/4
VTERGCLIRPQADQDIDQIADYLSDAANLETGLRFLTEVYAAFTMLAAQPGIGWPCRMQNLRLAGVRTFRVSERFRDYLIFYQLLPQRIEIIRIVHGSQDLEALFGDTP